MKAISAESKFYEFIESVNALRFFTLRALTYGGKAQNDNVFKHKECRIEFFKEWLAKQTAE